MVTQYRDANIQSVYEKSQNEFSMNLNWIYGIRLDKVHRPIQYVYCIT